MLDATQGPDPGAPFEIAAPSGPFLAEVGENPGRLRIAWTTTPTLGSMVDPVCVAAVEDTATLLEELGHEVVPGGPVVDGPEFARSFLLMVAAEMGADLRDAAEALGRKPRRAELEPATWALTLLAEGLTAGEYAGALRSLERSGREVGRFFGDFDLLLTPTLATPPPRVGELQPSKFERFLLRAIGALGSGRLIKMAGLLDAAAENAFDFTPWTPVYNWTGQPAMSVPLCWNAAGLPIGVHFVARFGNEATLFRIASQLEQSRPWFDRLPQLATTAWTP